MQTFHGHDDNYDASPYLREPHQEFRNIMRAGEATRDFTSGGRTSSTIGLTSRTFAGRSTPSSSGT